MNSDPLKIIVSRIGVVEISTGYDGGKIEVNSRDLIDTVETEIKKHGIECDEYGKIAAKVTIIVEPCGYYETDYEQLV